ncbi:PhnD/SsuA/transferrin family substrate-binding protein [Marinobacter sp. VGCF2001]
MLALLPGSVFAGQVPEVPRLEVMTEARSTTVASYRLQRYLQARGCEAELVFNQAGDSELVYRPEGAGHRRLLDAVSAAGQHPVPVWVTRKTAGVRSLQALEGRDVSIVAGSDPVSGQLALQALAGAGVVPEQGQRYVAGDFSSALGLLLHNNTHAAVSELGLVGPFLGPQGLTITWQGEPVSGAGWYARDANPGPAIQPCFEALLTLKRSDDRQIFNLFPEWVHGFATPDSQP